VVHRDGRGKLREKEKLKRGRSLKLYKGEEIMK
jgi:hypothetical protein